MEAYLKENSQPHVNICQNLTDYGLIHLKQADVLKLNREALQVYIDRITLASLDDAAFPVLKHYFELSRSKNTSFTFNNDIYGKLTHIQLEHLPKHIKEVLTDKNYFAALYRKGWGRELKEISTEPNLETPADVLERKRDLINKIRKWLAAFKTSLVSSFEDQLVIEALQIDLITGRSDTGLFLEFLKRPRDFSCFKHDYSSKLQHRTDYSYDSYWHSVHGLEAGNRFNQSQLIENYLRLVFREKPEHKQAEQFYGFFAKSFVDALFYKVLLTRGDTLENLHTLLPKEEL